MIQNIADELLIPVVKRVFDFLNASPTGTDEALLLADLRKAYLNFIISLFNSELEGVFISERNIGHLDTILQTILHFAKDNNDPSIQKMAFSVFLKMVTAWGSGAGLASYNHFVYNELIPTVFAVPMQASFNVADGQSLLVSSFLDMESFYLLINGLSTIRFSERSRAFKKCSIISRATSF